MNSHTLANYIYRHLWEIKPLDVKCVGAVFNEAKKNTFFVNDGENTYKIIVEKQGGTTP